MSPHTPFPHAGAAPQPPQSAPLPRSIVGNSYVPIVVEQDGRIERSFDIYSRLLRDRIIFIGSEIDPYNQVSNSVIAQLLFLQMQDPKKDVNIYINSPGGSVTAGLAIYDTMQFITCDVNTYCIGISPRAWGPSSSAAGTPGKRHALPNSDIMIHQVSGGASGYGLRCRAHRRVHVSNSRSASAIASSRSTLGEAPRRRSRRPADRDNYLTAEEAKRLRARRQGS